MKTLMAATVALLGLAGTIPDDDVAARWLSTVTAERWHVPALPGESRSDWVTAAAKGDGIADDTDALQAALDKLGDRFGAPKTLFIPARTYRLTNPLVLSKIQGAAVIGPGALTTLLWDGAAGARMFHSNRASRPR